MARKPPVRKEIQCPHCDKPFEVSVQAHSTMCPGCNKTIRTGNEKVKAYSAHQEFFTAGDLQITKKGTVIAEVRAVNVSLTGEIRGNVQVRESVSINKTGRLFGNLTTPRLSMKEGGQLVGYCIVGIPVEVPEDQTSETRPVTRAS